MAKSKTPAQYLAPETTPAASTTVVPTAYRAPSSDWERANVAPGWHVRIERPDYAGDGDSRIDGMVRLVAQDNRTLSVDTAVGSVQVTKDMVVQINMRPLTEWESGILASVATDPDRARYYTAPRFDPLSVAHVVREHWFRLQGGAKTARLLKAMTAAAKAASVPTAAPAAAVPAVAPATVADAS